MIRSQQESVIKTARKEIQKTDGKNSDDRKKGNVN